MSPKSEIDMTGHTKVVQVTNIAPQATKDQMQTLFSFLGKIEDIRLYPTIRDVAVPVQSRICYVKFHDSGCVGVAQHLTNTVFIDRALIVAPVSTGDIPDEQSALDLTNQGNVVPGLFPSEPKLPPNVTNRLEGLPPNQAILTHDPKLEALGLPRYPPLPATLDGRRIEEIRRTVIVINIPEIVSIADVIEFFSCAGEVKYARFASREGEPIRFAMVEFTEQPSIITALQMNGKELGGQMIKVYHSTQAIVKPQAKSNEAAHREIEEAMSRMKEAQNLISAAIDPVIGLLGKEKKRSRSHSRSRRSRSRSRSRRRRSRSRSRRHSRSRSRRRSRSHHRSSRSRSRRVSPRRRSHSRSRSRSHRSRSRSKRSVSKSMRHSLEKVKDKRDDRRSKDDKRDRTERRKSSKDEEIEAKESETIIEQPVAIKVEVEEEPPEIEIPLLNIKTEPKEDPETDGGTASPEKEVKKKEDRRKDDRREKDRSSGKDRLSSRDKMKSPRRRSRSISRSISRRKRSRSGSRPRRRSRSIGRKRSRSRSRRSHSRTRIPRKSPRGRRSPSPPRRRSRSRSRSRKDKKKDRDRSRDRREKDRDRDSDRRRKEKKPEEKEDEKPKDAKVARNYDEEEEGFDAADSEERARREREEEERRGGGQMQERERREDEEEYESSRSSHGNKDDSEDMDISNSP